MNPFRYLKVTDDSEAAESEAEEREFVAEQLLKILSGYDLSDNAGAYIFQPNCLS